LTDPTVTHRFQDNHAVQPARDDGSNTVADPVAAAGLAAIQQGYEEAKAGIVDPAAVPSSPADDEEPLPGTERIDLRQVTLPPVRPGTREATAAMPPPGRRSWWRGVRRAWLEAASPGRSES
jgi:hypothetical protein